MEQANKKQTMTRWPWRTLLLLWMVYLLTAQGRIGIEDAGSMLNLSRSLLVGSVSVPKGDLTVNGADGLFYCHYGPLTSVWWLPFVLAGRGLHAIGVPLATEHCEEFVVSFASSLIAVASLGYLCWYWRARGIEEGRMRTGVWLWGIGTCLWPYSHLPGSDLLMGLALLAAVVHFELRPAQARHLFLSGLWLGLSVLARKQAQTIVPVVGLWMAWRCWKGANPRNSSVRGLFRLGWVVIGALGPLFVQLTYNQLRFGSPFIEKYAHASLEPLTIGLWFDRVGHLLYGFDHGFLIYNGVAAFVVLVASPSLSSSGRRLLALLVALLVSQVAFLATLPFWQGGVCFGSRFLVFVALLAGVFWSEASFDGSKPRQWLFGVVVMLSVMLQLLGVIVDPSPANIRFEVQMKDRGFYPLAHVQECARMLGWNWGRLPPVLAERPALKHFAFQVPDLWWCQVIQLHQGNGPTPTGSVPPLH